MGSIVDDTIHKQSFSIDDLATRSVTIYPTRAAVVRDIESVVIKVGGRSFYLIRNSADVLLVPKAWP